MAMRHTRTMAVAVTLALGLGAAAEAQNNAPFSNTYRRPSVSPYTMLGGAGMAMGGAGGAGFAPVNPLVYQQLIQPREEQERQVYTQMRQGRQIEGLQNRVQMIQRDTTARQVNEQIRPTGHMATYLNMSHYYQQAR
ncbi:MAG: hypothetical protein ACKON7_08180 [Planctomycetaceae bacterium]